MKEKLKLIREIENTIGFKKFRVSQKSAEGELYDVLEFIRFASIELEETFVPKIEKILECRDPAEGN